MTVNHRRKVWQHDTENISEDQIREYFHRLGWEVERFGKDYGEDLFIRIFEEGKFNGKVFYVQLKGTKDIQQYVLKTDVYSYGVEAVNLQQWHQNPSPVIFIIWDIEKRRGFWLHIQPYIDKRLQKNPDWLKQEGKRNIHIPFDQTIPWNDDKRLLTLINEGPPLWQILANVNQKLNNLSSHYHLEARLTNKGTEITTIEKYPGASAENPINIKFTTSIPTNTLTGRELAEKVISFFDSGTEVKIPINYIKNLEFPQFIRQTLPEFTEDGFVLLSPIPNPIHLMLRFEFIAYDGEQALLEYIDMKVIQQGRKEVIFTNDDQQIPIKVQIVLHADGHLNTSFEFRRTLIIYQLLKQLQFQNCLSKPHTARLINLENGMIIADAKNDIKLFEAPPVWLLQTTEALNAFQNKIRKQIIIPDRELDEEEWRMLEILRCVFHEGKIKFKCSSLSSIMSILPEDIPGIIQFIEPFKNGKIGDLFIHSEDFITLFDTNIPLGKIKPIHVNAKLVNEQKVREKIVEQKESQIQLEFVLMGDHTITKEYVDYLSDED